MPHVPGRHLLGRNSPGSGRDAAGAGFADKYIYRELVIPADERNLDMEQVMRQEALAAFRIWGELEDKIEY